MKEPTFFILCSKFLNLQIFKFLDNKWTLTESNRFNRFRMFCAICELTLYQSNVNVNIFIRKNDYEYLDISEPSSYEAILLVGEWVCPVWKIHTLLITYFSSIVVCHAPCFFFVIYSVDRWGKCVEVLKSHWLTKVILIWKFKSSLKRSANYADETSLKYFEFDFKTSTHFPQQSTEYISKK